VARVFVDSANGDASLDLTPKSAAAKANVKVVHASPDAPGVDLFVDGTQANTSPLTFPNNTEYLPVDSGSREIQVAAAGGGATVIRETLALDPDKNYTIFAANLLSSIEPLVLEDDLTAPAAGKAHVRFVHLSPDAPAVDIAAVGVGTVFNNQAFKDATPFTPVDAGTLDLQVLADLDQGGTRDDVALTVNGVQLQAGKIYTIFANGQVAAGASNPLSASIIVHN
jgi:hypothetical protein